MSLDALNWYRVSCEDCHASMDIKALHATEAFDHIKRAGWTVTSRGQVMDTHPATHCPRCANKKIALARPTGTADAVTKSYVDGART